MKLLVLVVALVAGVFLFRALSRRPAPAAMLKAPENYAKSLAEDEKRAADAAAKANAAVQKETQAVNDVVQEAEKR